MRANLSSAPWRSAVRRMLFTAAALATFVLAAGAKYKN